MVVEKLDSLYESLYQKGEIINSSGISFELSSEDGSSWKDSDLNSEITYVHIHVSEYLQLSVCIYMYMYMYTGDVHVLYMCETLSVYLSTCTCIYKCTCIYLSVCVYLFVSLSIYLSIYLYYI